MVCQDILHPIFGGLTCQHVNLITEEACQEFAVKLPRKLIEDLNALAGEVGVT